ncbi:MAG: hypothetical protein ACXW1D_00535 [Halobacteriota archaeon]
MMDNPEWRLDILVRWVPKKPDEKISCWACRGRGVDINFGETECSTCCGNGFWYTNNTTTLHPEVPQDLVEMLRNTYKEWRDKG